MDWLCNSIEQLREWKADGATSASISRNCIDEILENARAAKLRKALEDIENLGAEMPNADNTAQMFRMAHNALKSDDLEYLSGDAQ